jgi:hypothetical protein
MVEDAIQVLCTTLQGESWLWRRSKREVFSFPQDQDIAVRVVLISYVLFNKLLKSYENKFLSIGSKKKV